jgi:thiamine-phosphate pyrophosphorylase
MLITDRNLSGGIDRLVADVDAALGGGVNAVQLREKDLPPRELLWMARRLRTLTNGRALLLVNTSLEVALAAGADGVHLPEDAAMVERPSRPFIVGRSVHSAGAAARAWAERVDYLVVGPIFETSSHPAAQAAGVKIIEDVATSVAIPVLAVGGVTAARVHEVIQAGASGVAVISAVLGAPSPRQAANEVQRVLDESWAATGRMST